MNLGYIARFEDQRVFLYAPGFPGAEKKKGGSVVLEIGAIDHECHFFPWIFLSRQAGVSYEDIKSVRVFINPRVTRS